MEINTTEDAQIRLKNVIQEITGDYYDGLVEEKNDLMLMNIPTVISLNIFKNAFPLYQKMIDKFPEIIDDVQVSQIHKLIIKSMEIYHDFSKAKRVWEKVKDKIKSNPIALLTNNEFAEADDVVVNELMHPSEFNLDENFLYQTVISTYCQNAAIISGFFIDGNTIDIDVLERYDSRLAFHAKKSALDQLCFKLFNKTASDYDAMRYVEYIDSTHPLNILSPTKIDKNSVCIAYLNVLPMNSLDIGKNNKIINSLTGLPYEIDPESSYQEVVEYEIPCKIANAEVKVKTRITKGVITANLLK